MRESAFQRRVIQQLRLAGAVVLNKQGTAEEGPGWPDLWVGHQLWQGWLELKMGNAWPSPVQCAKIGRLMGASVPVFVLRCTKTLKPDWELCLPVIKSPTSLSYKKFSASVPQDAGMLLVLRAATNMMNASPL